MEMSCPPPPPLFGSCLHPWENSPLLKYWQTWCPLGQTTGRTCQTGLICYYTMLRVKSHTEHVTGSAHTCMASPQSVSEGVVAGYRCEKRRDSYPHHNPPCDHDTDSLQFWVCMLHQTMVLLLQHDAGSITTLLVAVAVAIGSAWRASKKSTGLIIN